MIISRLTQSEIQSKYTHYARLFGVPIYFNEITNDVCSQNWVPEFFLDIGYFLFDTLMAGCEFPIELRGRIAHDHN